MLFAVFKQSNKSFPVAAINIPPAFYLLDQAFSVGFSECSGNNHAREERY
jgi:hypothetical protein